MNLNVKLEQVLGLLASRGRVAHGCRKTRHPMPNANRSDAAFSGMHVKASRGRWGENCSSSVVSSREKRGRNMVSSDAPPVSVADL